MTNEQYLKNLQTPAGKVDVILDTDAYNEIDDQYAIAYLIKNPQKLNVVGLTAAPYSFMGVEAKTGMLNSFDEIIHILELMDRNDLKDRVFKGSEGYLENEETPVISDAARFMAEKSREYSPENPLYIVAIGAITNVASALLLEPKMKENTVIVWLGGHAVHLSKTDEYNMRQDVAGARVVFDSGVPLVQMPCGGVVSAFILTKEELIEHFKGKNPICNYLYEHTAEAAESYAKGKTWSRVIWDVTAVAWLLNDNKRFMVDKIIPAPIPEYDNTYSFDESRHKMAYAIFIHRDALINDLITKLTED